MSITLVTWSGQTVTPQDDALVYQAAFRKSGLIYGGAVTIKSASVLHIAAGHGMIAGRKFTIEAQDINVELSGSGTKKGRLYIHLDLSNPTAPLTFMTEVANTLTPPIQTANVNITNGVYEIDLAHFDVSTLEISNLADVALKFGAMMETIPAYTPTVTFTDLPTSGDYLIEFYISTGENYTGIDVSTPGQVTLTYDESASARNVYCDIREA